MVNLKSWQKKPKRVLKTKKRKLKGTSLLLRIQAITGSTNLEDYKGSIKKLAIQCGYVYEQENYSKKEGRFKNHGIKQFIYEYHKINKTNKFIIGK